MRTRLPPVVTDAVTGAVTSDGGAAGAGFHRLSQHTHTR